MELARKKTVDAVVVDGDVVDGDVVDA